MNLEYTTLSNPIGLMHGKFEPWVIEWVVPHEAIRGFVIQHISTRFTVQRCRTKDTLSPQEIWKLLGHNGEERFEFWEAWRFQQGVCERGGTDKWCICETTDFYAFDSVGKIEMIGSAAFYDGDDLRAFGEQWRSKGANSGSPASGELMSTIKPPNLPDRPKCERRLIIEWDSCDYSSTCDNPTMIAVIPQWPINFGRRSIQNSTLQKSLAVKSSVHS